MNTVDTAAPQKLITLRLHVSFSMYQRENKRGTTCEFTEPPAVRYRPPRQLMYSGDIIVWPHMPPEITRWRYFNYSAA